MTRTGGSRCSRTCACWAANVRLVARAAEAAGIIWLALTIAFFALQLLPGDAVLDTTAASGASPAQIEARRHALGLDRSPIEQYMDYVTGIARGELGASLQDGRPVAEILSHQAPPTVTLAAASGLITLLIGVPLGLASGAGRRSAAIGRGVAGLFVSVPVLWSGTFLLTLVGTALVDANTPLGLLLPALAVGISGAGALASVVESEVRAVKAQPYVTAARAKGLPERVVVWRHVLRAATGPIAVAFVLQLGFLLGGVVFTEVLFNRPGLGRTLVQAALRQDFPLALGIVIWSAVWYAILLLVADVLARLLDPRLGAVE